MSRSAHEEIVDDYDEYDMDQEKFMPGEIFNSHVYSKRKGIR